MFEVFVQERRPKSVLRVLVDECGNGSHFGTIAAVLHFTSSHHFPGPVMSFEVLHLMHPWCDDHQSVRLMAVASETSRFGERSHEENKIFITVQKHVKNWNHSEIVLPLAGLT